ncbi:hypothetical protein Poly24_50110 [Rosistilla carotiformis]|uniref:Uncharacterized protein n=1 Tax=Rosistilla carotiformis TaxID=2528017 RepID=A0A518K0F0_9BACT|nr:hypothetical protein [Rosistilla carotiformis]QDV71276.1 hypothetical protein Poly24_50110 [Rosistilla carotiformis]
MNDTTSKSSSGRKSPAKLTAGGGAIGILIVLYALLQPILSKQLGIALPKLPVNVGADAPMVAGPDKPIEPTDAASQSTAPKIQVTSGRADSPTKTAADKSSTAGENSPKLDPQKSAAPKTGGGPLSQFNRSRQSDDAKLSPTKSAPEKTSIAKSDPSLKYGILKSIGRDTYMSPAGLRYTPGSQEGHRLKHLERHTADQPSRPGKHGVFDGGMEKTLLVLDQAYEKGTKGGHGTTKTQDDGRTIYTVDMGKRIGYIGGRDGNRMRKPMARRVRIVLDGDRVITAYPL